jgi:hypothetical protein
VSRVAVVLDASALVGYAKLHPAAGVMIAMVAEGADTLAGIPAAAYLAACWELDETGHDLLRALVTGADRVVEILPQLGPDTDQAASLDVELRRQGLGHAIIETLRHSATLATFIPDVAGRDLPDDSIIDLGM